MDEQTFAVLRGEMCADICAHALLTSERIGKSVLDAEVMEVMGRVPRHEFVPLELQEFAYLNRPLPIGFEKTISQPFIVALMTDLLQLTKGDVVLEVGTGLGYQAAILSELAQRVYTVEIIEELGRQAMRRIDRLGYPNIQIRIGDGSAGWGQHAPYDKVIVTAAPELIPPALINQLKPGGRMVIPAGLADQQMLFLLEKDPRGRIATHEILPVRFSRLEEGGMG